MKNLIKHYYVYILTNKTNKVLYTGVTNDIFRRMYEHRNKLIDGLTKKYKLYKLVYLEAFSYIKYAIEAEKKIKGWLRAKKASLIESKNPDWDDLFVNIQDFTLSRGIIRDPSFHSG